MFFRHVGGAGGDEGVHVRLGARLVQSGRLGGRLLLQQGGVQVAWRLDHRGGAQGSNLNTHTHDLKTHSV